MRGLGSEPGAAWNFVAERSRPQYRGNTGGHKGGRGAGFIPQPPLPKPPSKRQKVSTDSASSETGDDVSKPF